MKRLSAALGVSILIAGCSQGTKDSASASKPNPSTPAAASTKIDPAKLLTFKLRNVYLGCKESQEAARQVLAKFPGVSDLTIDAQAGLITMKLAPDRGFPSGELSKVGLYGWYELTNPDGSGQSGQATSMEDATPRDSVTLQQVFAGSAESRKRIEEVLAPAKVTFLGDGMVRSIRVDGKALVPDDLVASMYRAGFHASLAK